MWFCLEHTSSLRNSATLDRLKVSPKTYKTHIPMLWVGRGNAEPWWEMPRGREREGKGALDGTSAVLQSLTPFNHEQRKNVDLWRSNNILVKAQHKYPLCSWKKLTVGFSPPCHLFRPFPFDGGIKKAWIIFDIWTRKQAQKWNIFLNYYFNIPFSFKPYSTEFLICFKLHGRLLVGLSSLRVS